MNDETARESEAPRAADSARASEAYDGSERRFKRRIDCSSRSGTPAWADGRFR